MSPALCRIVPGKSLKSRKRPRIGQLMIWRSKYTRICNEQWTRLRRDDEMLRAGILYSLMLCVRVDSSMKGQISCYRVLALTEPFKVQERGSLARVAERRLPILLYLSNYAASSRL